MERKILKQLHSFLSKKKQLQGGTLLVSVLRPTLEYGSEVRACNKSPFS